MNVMTGIGSVGQCQQVLHCGSDISMSFGLDEVFLSDLYTREIECVIGV